MAINGTRIAALIAAVAVVGIAGGVLWTKVLAPQFSTSLADRMGQGDYRLEATDGEPFTPARLEGGPSAVFFGYTHCPDVCPTTLGDITVWQDDLKQAGLAPIRVYFVTVDPERDDLSLMTDYVSWVQNVVGVTGSRAEIDKAIAAFRIYARKVGEGADYTMDHSASVQLYDAKGHFAGQISYQEEESKAVDQLKALYGTS